MTKTTIIIFGGDQGSSSYYTIQVLQVRSAEIALIGALYVIVCH